LDAGNAGLPSHPDADLLVQIVRHGWTPRHRFASPVGATVGWAAFAFAPGEPQPDRKPVEIGSDFWFACIAEAAAAIAAPPDDLEPRFNQSGPRIRGAVRGQDKCGTVPHSDPSGSEVRAASSSICCAGFARPLGTLLLPPQPTRISREAFLLANR